MLKRKATYQRLIEESVRLFNEKGYYNTSMEDIAKACNIRKASIYYYIPSRKALVLDIIADFEDDLANNVLTIEGTNYSTQKDCLNAFSIATKTSFNTEMGRCLLNCLFHEAANNFPELMQCAKNLFQQWINALVNIIIRKFDYKVSFEIAEGMLAQFQGALIIGRLTESYTILEQTAAKLMTLLDD